MARVELHNFGSQRNEINAFSEFWLWSILLFKIEYLRARNLQVMTLFNGRASQPQHPKYLIQYSTRIKELGNWREAISVKRLGFMIKFFTTKCTYRCTMLFKVLEPFQQIHFFLSKNFFSSFWLILTTKITLKKNSFMCILVR